MSAYRGTPPLPEAPPLREPLEKVWKGVFLFTLYNSVSVFIRWRDFKAMIATFLLLVIVGAPLAFLHTKRFARWKEARAQEKALRWIAEVDARSNPSKG